MRMLVILVVCFSGIASAGPTSAEQEFDRGRTLLASGRVSEACAAFDASQQLAPAITTLLNQANCRERANELATAYRLFQDVERQTRDAMDEPSRRYHQLALDRAARLAPALSTVTLTTPAIAGLQIRRNGVAVDPSTFNRKIPIDGGTYTLEVSAPDCEAWRTTFAVGPTRDHVDVLVPELVPIAGAPRPVKPVVTVVAAPPVTNHVPWRWIAIAGALTAGAVGAEVWARSDLAKTDSASRSAGARERYFAIGLGSLGVVAAGVALYKYTHQPRPIARIGSLDVEPTLSPTHAGLSFTGRY